MLWATQQSLPGFEAQDEALVAATVVVIRQDSCDHTFAGHLNAVLLLIECSCDHVIA